ncbi:hypothetical protein [Micromonospora sp. NPDC005172]|uniref:hypothetical protein n=1 Tax=Micromonospora sp. NPDC005172 TaxID=3156867 RepID=UPI0033A97EED
MADAWSNTDTGRLRFATSARAAVQASLRLIGYSGISRVELISVPTPGSPDQNAPAAAPFSALDTERTKSFAKMFGGRRAPDDDVCVGMAAKVLLSSDPGGAGWSFFVSKHSARTDDQYSFAAVALRKVDLAKVPHLRTAPEHGTVAHSLVHAVVEQVLYRIGLVLASAPTDIDIHGLRHQVQEFVRTATASFIGDAVFAGVPLHDHGLFLDSISALPYEGRTGSGAIVAIPPDSGLGRIRLRLRSPAPISDVRAVRKLLEATIKGTSLLLHNGSVYGFGSALNRKDQAQPPPFSFRIIRRGTWQFNQGRRVLMHVQDGLSRLPSSAMEMDVDKSGLKKRIAWLLPDSDAAKLTKLAVSLCGKDHGAMLIISGHAAQEAARFSGQAFPVKPQPLDPEIVASLAEMDGGILVDEHGRCHAIGVLLDGHTGVRENYSRGSRYNNAARYLALDGDPEASPGSTQTVVIVYSSDGMVDILPPYPRVVHPSGVRQSVEHLLEVMREPARNAETTTRAVRTVDRLRFHLSAKQCEQLNAASDAVAEWPDHAPRPRRFFPDPRMDPDRFFSDRA